jgi:hypothetical protein
MMRYEAHFVVVDCWKCHVLFALTERMAERLQKTHKEFYCPRGHSCCYGKPTPKIDILAIHNAEQAEAKAAELAGELSREDATPPAPPLPEGVIRVERVGKRLQCPRCNKTYVRGWALADHLRDTHAVENFREFVVSEDAANGGGQ